MTERTVTVQYEVTLVVPCGDDDYKHPSVRVSDDLGHLDYEVEVEAADETLHEVAGAIMTHLASTMLPRWREAYANQEEAECQDEA
jgi:hypothetical protein